jgi:hypothetical protein
MRLNPDPNQSFPQTPNQVADATPTPEAAQWRIQIVAFVFRLEETEHRDIKMAFEAIASAHGPVHVRFFTPDGPDLGPYNTPMVVAWTGNPDVSDEELTQAVITDVEG